MRHNNAPRCSVQQGASLSHYRLPCRLALGAEAGAGKLVVVLRDWRGLFGRGLGMRLGMRPITTTVTVARSTITVTASSAKPAASAAVSTTVAAASTAARARGPAGLGVGWIERVA